MKKVFISFLCVSTIMCSGIPAFASQPNIVSPAPNSVSVMQQSVASQYMLKINGKDVTLGSFKIVKQKDQIMVPLRITSESLGFKVIWDGKQKIAHLNNGIMQSNLTLGIDNYCAYSSKAIGMTTPKSLGIAPTIIGGSMYVPVEYYKTLLTNEEGVHINGSVITISSEQTKADEKQGSAQIPSPLVEYKTLEEARNAVGFSFAVPTEIPDNYQIKDIVVISNELAEIFYKSGENEILYRTAKGDADISGDYTVYKKTKTINVGNTKVNVKGNGDTVTLATWTKDGISFSLAFDIPSDENVVSKMIESIK